MLFISANFMPKNRKISPFFLNHGVTLGEKHEKFFFFRFFCRWKGKSKANKRKIAQKTATCLLWRFFALLFYILRTVISGDIFSDGKTETGGSCPETPRLW